MFASLRSTHPAELLIIMPIIYQQPFKHLQTPIYRCPAEASQSISISVPEVCLVL